MKTIVERAAAFQRAAMTELYETHKQTMWYTALLLLRDKKRAAGAVAAVFKKIWRDMGSAEIHTEEQFANFSAMKLAEHCRGKLGKSGDAPHSEAEHPFLAPLTETMKWICILSGVAELGPVHIAKALKLDAAGVRAAVETAPEGYAAFVGEVNAQRNSAKVPAWVDEKVAEAIHEFAGQAEKAEKKRKRALTIAAAAVGALIVVVLLIRILGGGASAPTVEEGLVAEITVQDYGTITVALDSAAAPITVENFVNLADSGFYNGLTFHRIMEGFMMQGGDPLGNGTGGSNVRIKGEFAANGVDNPISHVRGVISMARAQPYDSASSQFFICHADSTFLDGQYAAFGYVTEGMDVVDAICADARPTDNNGSISPDQQPIIESIVILR